MNALERVLSRPAAKPYRSRHLINHDTQLNEDGHVDFHPGDPENPKNWSMARRWYVTFVAVLLVVNATFASSSPSGTVEDIAKSFNVSVEAAGLVITVFLLGYCAGPLAFAPLSETYGRRYIFYISFMVYIAFNFLCAFAPNFGSLLVGRFLTGTFVSCPMSNAPGVLADIWEATERGNALALFAMMTFAGPALGPVVGGFLQLTKDWRWDFYVLLMFAGVTAILMFTIPETYAPIILKNKARRLRHAKIPGFESVKAPIEASPHSLATTYKIALTRPWIILFDPISFLVAIYLSIVYTLLYMLFTIYPIVFQQKRGWNSGVGELPLIGTVIGAMLGGIIIFINSRAETKRAATGYQRKPEDRLPIAMIGGVGFSICMFWFAWSANYNSVPWIIPTIAGAFLATTIMLIFVSFLNYLTDTYLMYAASAIAANTVARSACGASAPLFTQYMFDSLGVGGGGSLIGGVAALLAIIPFMFYKYGEQIRIKSKFAPTTDISVRDEENINIDESESPAGDDVEEKVSVHSGVGFGLGSSGSSGSHSSSTAAAAEGAPEEYHLQRKRDRDVHQNSLGEPRDENTMFGKEDV